MPCGFGLGSCCLPTSGSNSPLVPCVSCVSESHCHNNRFGRITQDCSQIWHEAPSLWPKGTAFGFRMAGQNMTLWDFGQDVDGRSAGDVIVNWLMTDEFDYVWREGVSCEDTREDGTPIRPCGVANACCWSDCDDPFITGSEFGCLPYRSSVCQKGYVIDLGYIMKQTPDQFIGSTLLGAENCRYRRPLNPTCWLNPSTTKQHQKAICRCSLAEPPHLTQEDLDLGFTSCVRIAQDTRSWEDACELVIVDDLPCHTKGAPLVIDDRGRAAFYSGHRRVTLHSNVCTHILSDLYVDHEGVAHSVACYRFDAAGEVIHIGIGDLWQEECAAMYIDLEFDDDFNCDN